MTLTRTSAKQYFEIGDKPTQAQFSELFEGIVFQQGASAQFVQSNVSAQGRWDFLKDISVSGNVSAGTLNVTGAVSAASGHFNGVVSAATLNTTGDVQAATGKVTASALTVTGLTTLGSATGQTQPENNSTTALATTAFVNPLASAALRGFVKFSSGVILQWGNESGSGTGSKVVAFPVNFATTCYVVNANYNTTVSISGLAIDGNSVSAGGFTIYTNAAGFGFYWQAIGK